jgi:cephalosporin hydroxylase
MRYAIDTSTGEVAYGEDGATKTVPLYSTEGFEVLSDLWVKVGWNQKYTYTFSWLGRPVVQLPEDMVRLAEVIHRLQPDLIIECGVAHGGSLVFYASLCKVLERGRVLGIDVEIRAHNRAAIEAHPLAGFITLVEASSIAPETIARAHDEAASAQRVLVILDSAHDRAHVLAELESYSSLVTPGSYIVAMDGVMRLVADTPRGDKSWTEDNPISAVQDFLARHPEFVAEQPDWPFNESELSKNVTHAPHAYLRRLD